MENQDAKTWVVVKNGQRVVGLKTKEEAEAKADKLRTLLEGHGDINVNIEVKQNLVG